LHVLLYRRTLKRQTSGVKFIFQPAPFFPEPDFAGHNPEKRVRGGRNFQSGIKRE